MPQYAGVHIVREPNLAALVSVHQQLPGAAGDCAKPAPSGGNVLGYRKKTPGSLQHAPMGRQAPPAIRFAGVYNQVRSAGQVYYLPAAAGHSVRMC